MSCRSQDTVKIANTNIDCAFFEKSTFSYRALIVQSQRNIIKLVTRLDLPCFQGKYAVITDEIKPSAPRSLQHLRTLASYLQSTPGSQSRSDAVQKAEDAAGEDNLSVVVAATIFMHEKNYDLALRSGH